MLRPTASAIETRVVDGPCGESADQKDAEFVRRMDVFYYNRSRQGKIKKHVNEKYLRRSAFCGLRTCSKCEGGEFETHRLNPAASPNRVMSLPHAVVVDSKVLVKFIDLFQENVFQNVLIPLSAWKSVKSNHRKIFLKLRETYESNPSNFFVFGNDSFVETMPVIPLSRVDGENLLIATAADFLLKHWHDRRVVPIVLAVNDADMKAIGEHYKYVTTVFNYIKGMPKDDRRRLLIERVRALSKEEDARSKKAHFEYYINETQLTDGVRSGAIKVGKFTVTYENYQEAYVTIDDSDRVLVHGRAAMNRAISGDKVAVEILPESEWRAPEGRFRTKEADQAKEDDEIGDEQKDEPTARFEKQPNIIDRPLKHYCGILEAPNIKGGSICLFRPADKRIPPVRISNRGYHSAAADGSAGKKVVCSIVRWFVL
ncbi:Ribonuclease B and Ribonuclease II R domain containing protein, protein [Aphelenchoides fujianensis]|nr:Ribonuclease B and Ribonuclease II R domain containing protein, protein [Aphelenchoides fujianensis]